MWGSKEMDIFKQLQQEVLNCRKRELEKGVNSKCYPVTKYKSYGGHDPFVILPGDRQEPEVVTVSVNPYWTCSIS